MYYLDRKLWDHRRVRPFFGYHYESDTNMTPHILPWKCIWTCCTLILDIDLRRRHHPSSSYLSEKILANQMMTYGSQSESGLAADLMNSVPVNRDGFVWKLIEKRDFNGCANWNSNVRTRKLKNWYARLNRSKMKGVFDESLFMSQITYPPLHWLWWPFDLFDHLQKPYYRIRLP